ncbi:peptidoglycan-binding protein [Streptomyces sp. NPDC060022]|uniref:peptidoglycan-binding protein n=1 Tax=Streptomyces sp. NPDC060022 TaxID=3347039 RepID=UPI0036931849
MVLLGNTQFGKSHEDVRTVQRALIDRGRDIPDGVTGFFGDQTRAAYAEEQRAQGYAGADADGIPGCTSLTELGRLTGFPVDCHGAVAAPASTGKLGLPQVTYNDPHDDAGPAAMENYARKACALTGMDPRFGVPALVTIAKRESACNDRRWRVNTVDSNARGRIMADGHPQNCSRGATQCIPTTFAAYHQAETATTPYDVVACMCATINYVRDRYGVNRAGSNFASRVQQADPKRPARGY